MLSFDVRFAKFGSSKPASATCELLVALYTTSRYSNGIHFDAREILTGLWTLRRGLARLYWKVLTSELLYLSPACLFFFFVWTRTLKWHCLTVNLGDNMNMNWYHEESKTGAPKHWGETWRSRMACFCSSKIYTFIYDYITYVYYIFIYSFVHIYTYIHFHFTYTFQMDLHGCTQVVECFARSRSCHGNRLHHQLEFFQ